MKRKLPPKEFREPRPDLRRPSKCDEELEEAKGLLKPRAQFDQIRRDAVVKTFKK